MIEELEALKAELAALTVRVKSLEQAHAVMCEELGIEDTSDITIEDFDGVEPD